MDLTAPGGTDNIVSSTDDTFGLLAWGGTNGNNSKYIAYCWQEIESYSRFGSFP